jgi:hypothetical protein
MANRFRDSLLGIGRIVPYVFSLAADWLPPEIKSRLDTVRQDTAHEISRAGNNGDECGS